MMFPKPKRKPKRSSVRRKNLAEYAIVRMAYLKTHRTCEVEGCASAATEVHHRGGRERDRLSDPKMFMAVCVGCHQRIHREPAWAYEHGYLVHRNRKDEDEQEDPGQDGRASQDVRDG